MGHNVFNKENRSNELPFAHCGDRFLVPENKKVWILVSVVLISFPTSFETIISLLLYIVCGS